MTSRNRRRLFRVSGGLICLAVTAAAVFYLFPHRIEREFSVVDGKLITYSRLGRIIKEEVVDVQGNVIQIRTFPSWYVPLYRYRSTGRMAAEKTFYFDDPGKPNWSLCVTYIDQETMVVQTDADQDGIVDACECKPAEWGM